MLNKFNLNRQDTVLLIIDLQDNLMKAMQEREKVYKNTNLLLELAKQLEIPVVVSEQYPKGLGPTVAEIRDNLPQHHYIEKLSFSAFSDDLKTILEKLNRKTILVCGSETHICVFQTTRDLVAGGFNVHVVKDAVCSRFNINYQSGIELMHDVGAVITNAETVIFDLLKQAGTPEFKVMSRLLK